MALHGSDNEENQRGKMATIIEITHNPIIAATILCVVIQNG
jgi:hypothetical protein